MPATNRCQPPEPTDVRDQALGNLRYIRQTMDSAGSFSSVPGRGTMAVGLIGLFAAALSTWSALQQHWLAIWLGAAALAIPTGGAFLARKLRAQHKSLLAGTPRRFVFGLAPPLAAGALMTVCLALDGHTALIPGVWLLCYGAGVSATGSFSIRPVAVMGGCFMALGGVALFSPEEWHIALLATGFGGLHIVFGHWIERFYGG